ncbi:MAG: response regulator transcription factor [Phycisphaerae bacterium]|nr:response regulator transcription factor [Phycisphaerae bacterium]
MVERKPIRVMCVDDHAFLIEGLRARIALESDMIFVGSSRTLDGLKEEIAALQPDVLLIDVEIPGPDVFQVILDLHRSIINLHVVVLSAHVRDRYIDSAIASGARGYLAKTEDPGTIIDGVRRVVQGHFAFSPDVAPRVHDPSTRGSGAGSSLPGSRLGMLTPREQQILRMIGQGQSRTAIAQVIHRSPKTVDAHRASIMEKLGIHDRVELARYAIREGLVEI